MAAIEPIDRLLARLEPEYTRNTINAAATGGSINPATITHIRDTLSSVYTSVAVSGVSDLLAIGNTTDKERRLELGKKLADLAPPKPRRQGRGEEGSAPTGAMRLRLLTAQTQLKQASDELDNVRKEMQIEIDLLRAELDAKECAEDEDDDKDGDGDDGDDDEPLTDPVNLYITQVAWRQAIDQVRQWRPEGISGTREEAEEFVSWLDIAQIGDKTAAAVLRLLQRAVDFDADWIDPSVALGSRTSDEMVAFLRAATVKARSYDMLDVVHVKREDTMTHIVYTQDSWPAVIASLRVYNTDNWAPQPIDYLRWLNEDDKRRQLLALLSSGSPVPTEITRPLSDASGRFLELVIQEADDQLKQNRFDFIPVPLQWIKAQLKDVLKLLDDELPNLTAKITTDQLQSTEVYEATLARLQEIRKQLAADWLMRMSYSALAELVDDAMSNDTDDNRPAVVAAFDRMLDELNSERRVTSVRWVI